MKKYAYKPVAYIKKISVINKLFSFYSVVIKTYLKLFAKHICKRKKKKPNWATPENFDVCFHVIFDC